MTRFPSLLEGGWATLPIDMIRAFSGHSNLPVYEFNENDVVQPRHEISPGTAQPTAQIPVHAWRLAHAVKKADCARWPTSRILWPSATGFLLENIHLFDWNSANLRLASGMSGCYADFSRTSLSGRIGQGMALLFLEKKGYSYVGRFTALYPRCGSASKTPDFVVENNLKEQVLAEAKGRFVPPNDSPEIKKNFRKALIQLRGGHKYLSSSVHGGFAIGTFLREIGDPHKDPSLTAYVETGPGKAQGPVGLPPDAVRRANYAAWLSLMGFDGVAGRLRTGAGEPERRSVPFFRLGEDTYVVAITSIRPSYRHHAHDPDLQSLIRERWRWILSPYERISIGIVGLDLRVVRALETAVREPESQALMNIDDRERRIPEEFPGSVFSDGSLIGEIDFLDTKLPAIEPGNIEL